MPLGSPTALPAGPSLAGSSDPLLAASGWVETEVGPLTGLEPEANQLPTATSVRTLLLVFAVSTLTLSSLSWISTNSAAVWAAVAPGVEVFWLALWIVPMEKLSWKGNATFGSTWAFVGCLPPLSWDRSYTQSCCLNSVTADISDWALRVVTTFSLESQVQSPISWGRTWLKILSDNLR